MAGRIARVWDADKRLFRQPSLDILSMERQSFSKDPDTAKLLSIVAWNLTRFFGYDDQAGSRLVSAFYANFTSTLGDDFYHHEGPFRSAALMHYMIALGGTREGFIEWLNREGL